MQIETRSFSKTDQIRKAEAFRKMHDRSRLLLLPNAWDAISAALFEKAGFRAIATTSAGVAWALGYTDGEGAPVDEIIAATSRIARAVSVPVTADIEGGFGNTPQEVAETVSAIIAAGAVGINLEDGTHQAGAPLRSIEDAAARIRAAREAASIAGIPIVINARTDVFTRGEGDEQQRFEIALHRARSFFANGADCFFPIGLSDPKVLARLVQEVNGPVNTTFKPGVTNISEMEQAGVARLSTATSLATASNGYLYDLAQQLFTKGTFSSTTPIFPYPEAQALFTSKRNE